MDSRDQIHGYRMQFRKDTDRVRLFARRGFDWTERYPPIVATALKLKADSFTTDGETVCVDDRGLADFARVHSQCFDGEAIFYAFDLMELDGNDLKALPLIERKARLHKLLRRATRVHYVDHGPDGGGEVFRAACELGIEGVVSKRAACRYMPGPKRRPRKISAGAVPARSGALLMISNRELGVSRSDFEYFLAQAISSIFMTMS